MTNAIMISGIWFIGFSIFTVGYWIVEEFLHVRNELDNIRLEIQYLEKK